MTEFTLDAKMNIPVWVQGANEDEEKANVRAFIRDLKRIKELEFYKGNEALLISLSLNKSNKTSIYEELPADAEKSIQAFIKYLQRAYGSTKMELLEQIRTLKQKPSENPHSFMSRVITLYYEARDKEKKKMTDIETWHKTDLYDITNRYIEGLHDSRVKVALKQRIDQIKFHQIPDITKNIQQSLVDEKDSVFAIDTVQPNSESDEMDDPDRFFCNDCYDDYTFWKGT
jgi:hypothetical protein